MGARSHDTKIDTQKKIRRRRRQIKEIWAFFFYIIRHLRAEARFDDVSEFEVFFELPVTSIADV
jgi:hypothetical protein